MQMAAAAVLAGWPTRQQVPRWAAVAALALLAAAAVIAVQSVREIITPHHLPHWSTLVVLAVVVVIKEAMARWVKRAGTEIDSTALHADAWHHRSDAITSAAAFVGISIALIGGRGYESADDWAALVACGVIAWNGSQLLRSALDEVMDVSAPPAVIASVKELAGAVDSVVEIEKCRIRKSGLHLTMDIHVLVDGALTVRCGHEIAGQVKRRLLESQHRINDVTVHIEPVKSPLDEQTKQSLGGSGSGPVTNNPPSPPGQFSGSSPHHLLAPQSAQTKHPE